MSDRVHELAQVWREMIAIDHHKHKDGQFFVTKIWDYDQEKPEYYAEHHAYIGDDLYGSRHGTYAQAEVDLANHILKQIREQQAWAERVMADPEESEGSEREAKHMLAVIERNAELIKGDPDACEPADLPCVNGFSCDKHQKTIEELLTFLKGETK